MWRPSEARADFPKENLGNKPDDGEWEAIIRLLPTSEDPYDGQWQAFGQNQWQVIVAGSALGERFSCLMVGDQPLQVAVGQSRLDTEVLVRVSASESHQLDS